MASPNSTFTEIVTTTLREHPGVIADNVSGHNALYSRLKARGKIKKLDGGYEIVRPLDYAENSTFQRYSGYDTLNISASDVLSAAKYSWVQSAVNVTASGLELRQNSGKNQIVDLAKSRLKNAMRTAANNMSVDLYSSGSLTNQMGGLGHIIQSNGQGTVGGIDSGTYTFWRNQFREIASSNAWTKSTIRDEMQALWISCVRGTDKPDLLVSTNDFYSAYWGGLTDLQRYTKDSGEANMGFQSLMFNTAQVIHDNNSNFSSTGETMYFLNTEYLELIVHRDANWNQLDDRNSVNQDAVVIPIIWQGQLTCSNRSLQGVLLDAS
jgi:hypothetical protein